MIIPFTGPSVGPSSIKEEECYDLLQAGLKDNTYSASIGFITSFAVALQNGMDKLKKIKKEISPLFSTQHRILQAWSIVLLCVKKVYNYVITVWQENFWVN